MTAFESFIGSVGAAAGSPIRRIRLPETGLKRFTDEARSYNHFVRGMYESHEAGVPTIPAWFVADHDHMMKYGLGMIYPASVGPLMKHWLDTGYIVRAQTLRELATKIGVDATGLEQTVAKYNAPGAPRRRRRRCSRS